MRIDRLATQPNVELDGIARVYDAHHDRKTFLFVRGQESQPKEDEPLAPGVPAALGPADLRIEPVHLPLGAYNTGLKSYVRDELRSNALRGRRKGEIIRRRSREPSRWLARAVG